MICDHSLMSWTYKAETDLDASLNALNALEIRVRQRKLLKTSHYHLRRLFDQSCVGRRAHPGSPHSGLTSRGSCRCSGSKDKMAH
jgi:hypothetical protein